MHFHWFLPYFKYSFFLQGLRMVVLDDDQQKNGQRQQKTTGQLVKFM